MIRELELPAVDLPVVCVLKMRLAPAAIQANVPIRNGAKTGNVQFPRELGIAMSAVKNAEKDC